MTSLPVDNLTLRSACLSLLRSPTDKEALPALSTPCLYSESSRMIHFPECRSLLHSPASVGSQASHSRFITSSLGDALSVLSDSLEWCPVCSNAPESAQAVRSLLLSGSMADAYAVASTLRTNPTHRLLTLAVRSLMALRLSPLHTDAPAPALEPVLDALYDAMREAAPILLPAFLERVATVHLRRVAASSDVHALCSFVRDEGSYALRTTSSLARVCSSLGVSRETATAFLADLDSLLASDPVCVATGYRSLNANYSAAAFFEEFLALVAPSGGVFAVALPLFAAMYLQEHDRFVCVLDVPPAVPANQVAPLVGALLPQLLSAPPSSVSVASSSAKALEAALALLD